MLGEEKQVRSGVVKLQRKELDRDADVVHHSCYINLIRKHNYFFKFKMKNSLMAHPKMISRYASAERPLDFSGNLVQSLSSVLSTRVSQVNRLLSKKIIRSYSLNMAMSKKQSLLNRQSSVIKLRCSGLVLYYGRTMLFFNHC